MTKEKTEPTRDEKTAVLWAALKTLPDEYEIHVAMPGASPLPRRFIGHDSACWRAVLEAAVAKHRHAYDIETLARLRAKEAGGG